MVVLNFTNNVIIDDSTTDFDICVGQSSSWAGCNCSQPNLYVVPLSAECLNACAHQAMCEGNGGTPGQNTRDYVPGSPSGAVTVIACAFASVLVLWVSLSLCPLTIVLTIRFKLCVRIAIDTTDCTP